MDASNLMDQAKKLMDRKDEMLLKFRSLIPHMKSAEKQADSVISVDDIITKVNADDKFFSEKIKELNKILEDKLK